MPLALQDSEGRRHAALAVCLTGTVLIIALASLGSSPTVVPTADTSHRVRTSAVPVSAAARTPWADTVQVDAIAGNSLAVHSIRHPGLPPYTIDVDSNTLFMAAGGLLAPMPGMHPGSQFYFTGAEETARPLEYRLHALRVFYSN